MNGNFFRRLGPDPHSNGIRSAALNGCPDLWELNNGDIAVIGIDITNDSLNRLPPSAGCGPDERIVRIPRAVLLAAQSDILALR